MVRRTAPEPGPARRIDRRTFLKRGAGAALALLGASAALTAFRQSSPGASAAFDPWDIPGLTPEVTPVDSFYTVSKNLFDPVLKESDWSLRVDGLVHRPFTLDYRQLTESGPTVRSYVTLTCISNDVGGNLTGNALWRGIPLRDVLQQAGVMDRAVDLMMEAADGYTDSIPIDKAMHPDTLLVWEMNGAPLTPKHGFPARLIVPGIYGMKNVKWVTRLSVVDYDYKGFWERRGWSDEAIIKTWSRFDVPDRRGQFTHRTPAIVAGVAYAGDRGVSAVEISADRGLTWLPAELKEGLGPYAWRLWKAEWIPQETGSVELWVRAIDGAGTVQSEVRRSPLPDGASGYHYRQVPVRS